MSALIHVPPPLIAVPTRAVWAELMRRWAEQYGGVLERPGEDQDHPLIVEMLALAGVRDPKLLHDETPWCASCGAAAVIGSGMAPPPRAYHARSWEGWGRRLDPKGPQGDERVPGCFVVLWRGSLHSGLGHLTTWERDLPNGKVECFGGNQHNRLCSAPEDEFRVLSYRWPDESCLVGADR